MRKKLPITNSQELKQLHTQLNLSCRSVLEIIGRMKKELITVEQKRNNKSAWELKQIEEIEKNIQKLQRYLRKCDPI